jgi:hypothetical protein
MRYFNTVPTSFSLDREQVDQVISTGKNLLRKDPDYLRLLRDLGADSPEPGVARLGN